MTRFWVGGVTNAVEASQRVQRVAITGGSANVNVLLADNVAALGLTTYDDPTFGYNIATTADALANGQSYLFAITEPTKAAQTAEALLTDIPPAPMHITQPFDSDAVSEFPLVLHGSNGTLHMSWDDLPGATGYATMLTTADTQNDAIPADGTTQTFLGLSAGKQYKIYVMSRPFRSMAAIEFVFTD